MATVNEHIYTIQNLVNSGTKSDDASFSNRLILHLMNITRVLLLKRKADKKQKFDPSDFQSFCMPLCESNWQDCPCLPDVDCHILKSRFEIPKALTSRTGLYLTVRYLSGREIGETTPSAMRYRRYSLTKSKKAAWFIDNNYLYITNVPKNRLKAIYVTGIFIDPTDLADITLCDDDTVPCFDLYEDEYPISGELIDPMYKMVLEYIVRGLQIPEDLVNNAKDNGPTPAE
jgi:hypothetical protein